MRFKPESLDKLVKLTKFEQYTEATNALLDGRGDAWATLVSGGPGFIASPMTDVLNDQQREAILGRIPAGRLGSGDEIAAAAVYLSSDEAAYVTGQTLHVNGGMAMI